MTFQPRSEEQGHEERSDALLRQTVGLVASLPEVEPPADLRQRVAKGLAQIRDLKPMHCAQASEALDPYLEGELNRADERALHLHLAVCGGCRRQVEQARAAIRATRGLLELAPPVGVGERVAAEMEARAPRLRRLRPAARRIFATLVPLAAAAALLLAVRTQGPGPGVPTPVASEPVVTAEQPAERDAAPEAVATSPESEAVVASAALAPAASRRVGRVRSLIARVAESVVPTTVAEAAEGPAADDLGAMGREAAESGTTTGPDPADRMAAAAERESVIESEAMLAMVPAPPGDETTPASAEPPAGAAAPSGSQPESEGGASGADQPTPPGSARKALDVRAPLLLWPEVIRIVERNRSRPVDLPLIRREY